MNQQPIRMFFATVALSAVAALLAGTGNARLPEGDGVHTVPAQSQRHGTVAKPQQAARASVVLDPAIWSAILRNNTRLTTNPQQAAGASVVLDPAIWSAILRNGTRLTTNASVPYVDPATFEGYRG
jgi:hypothetical protein